MVQAQHLVRQQAMEGVALLDFEQLSAGALEDFFAQRPGVKLHASDHAG